MGTVKRVSDNKIKQIFDLNEIADDLTKILMIRFKYLKFLDKAENIKINTTYSISIDPKVKQMFIYVDGFKVIQFDYSIFKGGAHIYATLATLGKKKNMSNGHIDLVTDKPEYTTKEFIQQLHIKLYEFTPVYEERLKNEKK